MAVIVISSSCLLHTYPNRDTRDEERVKKREKGGFGRLSLVNEALRLHYFALVFRQELFLTLKCRWRNQVVHVLEETEEFHSLLGHKVESRLIDEALLKQSISQNKIKVEIELLIREVPFVH